MRDELTKYGMRNIWNKHIKVLFKVRILYFWHAHVHLVIISSGATEVTHAAGGTRHTKSGQRQVLAFALFAPDTARQLDVLGLQGHTAAVQRDEVCVLQQPHQVGLSCRVKCRERLPLDPVAFCHAFTGFTLKDLSNKPAK